jgi:site-specific DNA recombinase
MRVLGSIRLSRLTDATTWPERQREQIEQWARLHGHTVAHITTDTDVSGKVSPFARPGLGPWLTDSAKLDAWDVLVTAKLDRATRSVVDLGDLIEFCRREGKSYASVSESIDLTGAAGRMVANVIVAMAQFERERTGERRAEAAAKLRADGRYGGGDVPYGYRVVGKRLVINEATAEHVRMMARSLIGGSSLNSIAKALNDAGIPAPKTPNGWRAQAVRKILGSRAVTGAATYQGSVVLDDDGNAVKRAEPILDLGTWQQCADILARGKRAGTRAEGRYLTRIAFCALCDSPLHGTRAKGYKGGPPYLYYLCEHAFADRGNVARCPAKAIRADYLDAAVDDSVLSMYGDAPYGEHGNGNSDRQAAVKAIGTQIADLTQDQFVRDRPRDDYDDLVAGLRAEQARLRALPEDTASGWQPTGQTVGEVWQALDRDARAALLRRLGVKVYAKSNAQNRRDRTEPSVIIEGGELTEMARALGAPPVSEYL